ncbi:hypothetical protein M0R45_031190 [Rubus argutus]|uniref:Uncharacterized protein n=1 Tax=Rubus argutus TaxID=59490 RepID=A0AAW1WF79_RUBAR
MLSFTACKAYSGEASSENGVAVAKIHNREIEFNRINCLVWVLHESARSFFVAIESLELTGSSPGIAMAWSGKDIDAWHKRLSYQIPSPYSSEWLDVVTQLKRTKKMEVRTWSNLEDPPSRITQVIARPVASPS